MRNSLRKSSLIAYWTLVLCRGQNRHLLYPAEYGPLVFRVVVMNAQRELRAVAGCRPFEHLLVAIRVTKRSNRRATNVHLDTNWFAFFVVDELNLGQLHQHRCAVARLELQLARVADDLLRQVASSSQYRTEHRDGVIPKSAGD
jgi:hypothetical protein